MFVVPRGTPSKGKAAESSTGPRKGKKGRGKVVEPGKSPRKEGKGTSTRRK